MDTNTKIALVSLAVAVLSFLGQLVVGVYALGVFRGEFKQMKRDVELLIDVHVRNGSIPPRQDPGKGGNGAYERWRDPARERSS